MKLEKYKVLISKFVEGELSADEFETAYLDMFKSEEGFFGEEMYEILQELFCRVDAYCADESLRGSDNLDTDQLMESA